MKFSGLSAFPLTPMNESGIQKDAFIRIMNRLTDAKVDSIGILGSTGSFAYLNRAERVFVTELTLAHSNEIPVMVGIGATSTREVLSLAEDAQKAGAHAVMLAPVSYQKLTDREVFGLYQEVTKSLSVPLCVYDNPSTTNFIFTDDLHAKIAQLPYVGSIKLPPIPENQDLAKARVSSLRNKIPSNVSIGISGDWTGLNGLKAGCDLWYSAIGGLLPIPIQEIIRASQDKNYEQANQLASALAPLFEMFKRYGSIRVIASAAEILGVVDYFCLPHPLKSISDQDKQLLAKYLIDFK